MTDKISSVNSGLLPSEKALHNNFLLGVKHLQRDLVRTAYFLLQIQQCGLHRKLGYQNLAAYAARFAGLTERQTRDFLEMAKRLRRFPEVEEALAKGFLSWSKARLITTRANPAEQAEWIDRAQSLTVREIERALPSPKPASGRAPNAPADGLALPTPPIAEPAPPPPSSTPRTPKAPSTKNGVNEQKNHYFTLRFTGEQYALALRLLEATAGQTKEEKFLAAMAGEAAAPRLPYLLVVLECPNCGSARIPTSRGEVVAPEALLEAARCDAAIEDAAGHRRRVISPRVRRQALKRARYRCQRPGCSHTQFLEVHHRIAAAAGGGSGLENLIVLCSKCHRQLHEKEHRARAALRDAPE